MHNIFNQFSIFRSPTFTKSLYFKITKSPYKIITRDIKSGSLKKRSYQVPIASIFSSEMLSFQVGAFKVFKAFLLLKGNSNFFKQFSFKVKFRFTDSAKEGFEKSKGKVTPLASDGDFGRAGPFKKPHYIDTSNIHKLQVHLS